MLTIPGVFNPEHNSERRAMPSIPENMHHELLEKLILTDVALCDWSVDELRHPIIVGIHFIKTAVCKPVMFMYYHDSYRYNFYAADGGAPGLEDDTELAAPGRPQVLLRPPRAAAQRHRRRKCHRHPWWAVRRPPAQ